MPSRPRKVFAWPSAIIILSPLEKFKVPAFDVSLNGLRIFLEVSGDSDSEYLLIKTSPSLKDIFSTSFNVSVKSPVPTVIIPDEYEYESLVLPKYDIVSKLSVPWIVRPFGIRKTLVSSSWGYDNNESSKEKLVS